MAEKTDAAKDIKTDFDISDDLKNTPALRHVYEAEIKATRESMWSFVSEADWPTRRAFYHVVQERRAQASKWGGATHDDSHNSHDWIAYLCKHLGKAVMEPWDVARFRKAMVRVAALAIAAIEWCDRIQERPQLHRNQPHD